MKNTKKKKKLGDSKYICVCLFMFNKVTEGKYIYVYMMFIIAVIIFNNGNSN